LSSALAIAAVTAVLKDLLINGLIDRDLNASIGDVNVTALPPDRITTGADEASQLNLFLYNVSPNSGWRNTDLPSRNGNGDRIANPPLALDLNYWLSAYGAHDFHAEILLGYAMQLLHENPVLPRAAIRTALAPTPVAGGGGLPPTLQALAASDLAEQIEQIKIALRPLTVDDLSKMWTAFQAKYRPSACYTVSVVLIESAAPKRSPLPVLVRGENDRGVVVQPNLLPPFPTLFSATFENQQTAARLNQVVTLDGVHLDGEPGDTVVVLLNHRLFNAPAEIHPLAGATDKQIAFRVPNSAADFPAGVYAASVGFIRAGKLYRATNALGLALAPNNPTLPASPIARDSNGDLNLTVTCAPDVWRGQRASLLLGDREALAAPFNAAKTNALGFAFSALPPDDYFVRLRVDGVESILIDRTVTPPVFDNAQQVTIV
jgi:hypothetical protein